MKGLLIKDLYAIANFRRQYGLMLLFMGGWSLFSKSFSFFATYSFVLSGTLVLSIISMDEAVHFERYALTMPISAKTLVKEKYVMTCICIAAGSLFALLVECIAMLALWHEGVAEWLGLAVLHTFFLSACVFSLPFIFKYGVEKGRYIYMVIMFSMAAVIVGFIYLTKNTHVMMFEGTPSVLMLFLILGILLLLDVVVVSVSYRISLKVVKDKEW